MVLAHLHLNMALMRAVLYRCPNVASPNQELSRLMSRNQKRAAPPTTINPAQ